MNAVALVPNDFNNEICSTGFSVLRPTEYIYPMYLFFFVQTRDFIDIVSGQVRGMLYPAITDKQVRKVNIPLPLLPEQRRITAKIQELMQDLEHARAACDKQIETAKALPAAYLREVFESDEAKKWEKKNLGDVCEIIMGQSPPSDSYNKGKLGLPFFQGKADFGYYFPVPQIYCSNPNKIAKPNDVLISVRAPVGPVNLANQECCIGRGLSALRPNEKLDPWFLFFYFKIVEHNWKGRGSTFDAIKRNDLDNVEVPFPLYAEQKRIVSEIKKEGKILKIYDL